MSDNEGGRKSFDSAGGERRGGGYKGGRKPYGKRTEGSRDERRGNGGNRGGRKPAHKGRGGKSTSQQRRSHPQRSGFREERLNQRMADPDLPNDIDVRDLDPMVLQDLKVLSKDNAEAVAKHMIMAATWMEDDAQLALRHARAAKNRAGRVSVVREVNGIAAYRAQEWKEALSELRAARRISGGPGLMAVMADCERGLGKPEKALELAKEPEAKELDEESRIELAIVLAGARQDLGQNESAVVTLSRLNPNKDDRGISACRLSYAYANALEQAGRTDEAKDWFQHTVAIDEGEWTDAAERVKEIG